MQPSLPGHHERCFWLVRLAPAIPEARPRPAYRSLRERYFYPINFIQHSELRHQLAQTLREQHTTPTAQSYADGFLSEPSA
jgi:hypothetical protein